MFKTGMSLSFKYNSDGIRTQKAVENGPTTTYHVVGDRVTFETNGQDTIYYTYNSNNDLVSMNLNCVEYYYIRNAQGDIIGLFDKNGATVASYTYDSWGKLISIKDGSGTDIMNDTSSVGYKNPYRYRGYRYDTETGLYYLQSRYYNPEWGRFINMDATAGSIGELLSHNVFAYCMNNPIVLSDEDGFRPLYCANPNEETEEERQASLAAMRNASSSTNHVLQGQQQTNNNSIMYAKGGKSQPNSKFRGMSDEEINNGANDRSLSGAERREYQQEQKYRGLRDVNKRKELFGGGNKAGRKNDFSFDEITTGMKWGTAIYIIISEGSRIVCPPRNLVPIP